MPQKVFLGSSIRISWGWSVSYGQKQIYYLVSHTSYAVNMSIDSFVTKCFRYNFFFISLQTCGEVWT